MHWKPGKPHLLSLLLLLLLILLETCEGACSTSSSSTPCDLYICSQSCDQQGFPPDSPIYPTAADALNAVGAAPNVRLFFAPSTAYLDDLYLDTTIETIVFQRFGSSANASTRPELGRVRLVPGFRSTFSISFIGVVMTNVNGGGSQECLEVAGGMRLNVFIEDTKVLCGMTLQSLGSGSNYSISRSAHFACGTSCPTLDIMSVNSSVYIVDATMDHKMRITVQDGSIFELWRGTHLGALSLGTDLNSTILLSNAIFNQTIAIASDWPNDAKKMPDVGMIKVNENIFVLGFDITGLAFGATIQKNTFLGIPRSDYVRPNQNLYLRAECRAKAIIRNNYFACGTFFISMPNAHQDTTICPGFITPYKETIIRNNSFPIPATTNPYFADLMPRPVIPAIAVIDPTNSIGIYASQQSADSTLEEDEEMTFTSLHTSEAQLGEDGATRLEHGQYEGKITKRYASTKSLMAMTVDASENWWGDASGPWLCCNPTGKGGYSTPLVKTDRWCLDRACRAVSEKEMSTRKVSEEVCLTSCCPQVLTSPQRSALIALNVIGNVALVVAAIVVLVWHRRCFNVASLQKSSKLDIFDRLVHLMYTSLFFSTLGASLILATAGTLFYINSQTTVAPRQERIQIDASFVLVLFTFIAILQLDLNGLMAIALLLRDRYPKFLHFLAGKNYVINLLYLTFITTISLFWLPSLLGANFTWAHLSFLEAAGSSVLTSVSRLSPLIYLAAMPTALMTLLVMIPNHTLNNLLYYYEYSTITDALEAALLKEMAQSEHVSKKARTLRILSFLTLPFAITLWSMHIYLLYNALKNQSNANKNGNGSYYTGDYSPSSSPTPTPSYLAQNPANDASTSYLSSISRSIVSFMSSGLYTPPTSNSLSTPPSFASANVTDAVSWKRTWFLPLIDTPGRWINSLSTSTLGIISTIFTIFGTFYYQRVWLFTLCSTALLLAMLGPLENGLFELSVVISAGSTKLFLLHGAHFAFCILVTIAFIILIVFTWRLRNLVIEQLPLMAVSNLNAHLDALWQSNSPTMDKDRLTRLITESEAEDETGVKLQRGGGSINNSVFSSTSSVFSDPTTASEYESLLSSSTDNEA